MLQSDDTASEIQRPPVVSGTEALAVTPTRLGDYLLEQEIAHGGMGVVFRARQLSLGRTVAVKLLLLGRHSSAESIQRFRREARSAAGLRHPHIVSIFEVGECDGQHFLSMELVEGPDLAQRLRDGPLPVREAAEYVRTLALAVEYAHGQGVLHRDLKPSNVLIDPFGQPRLTDFGLAKPLDGSSDLTETGRLMGSPNYLAPEAAAGRTEALGAASDIYSLGAMFYELLTGRPPFLSPSLQDTLLRIRDAEPVALRRLNSAIPADLETICLKCLEKNPLARYPSAQALADDLDHWLRGEPIRARPVPGWERAWKWGRRNPRLAASLLGTVLAGLAVVGTLAVANARIRTANRYAELEAETSRQRLVRLNVQTGNHLVEEGDPLTALAWFVEALALERGDQAQEDLLRRRIGTLMRANPALEGLWFLDGFVADAQLSSDGAHVAALSEAGVGALWDVKSGKAVLGSVSTHLIRFSPDGRFLTTWTVGEGSRMWNAADGSPVPGWPKAKYAFAQFGQRGSDVMLPTREGVARFDVATGNVLGTPFKSPNPPVSLMTSPDGHWVVGYGIPQRLTVWDASAPEAPRWREDGIGILKSMVVSGDSRRVAVVLGENRVRQWNLADGTPLGPELVRPDNVYSMDYSPDGNRLVTAEWSGAAYVWDAATGLPVGSPLVHQGGVKRVQYSPDGRYLVTASWDTTVRFWDPVSGTPRPMRLRHGGFVTALDFSRDGSRLLTGCQDSAVRLWRLPSEPLLRLPVKHPSDVVLAQFHPRGTWLVTASVDGTINVWDRRTGQTHQVLHVPEPIAVLSFSPDGQRLLIGSANGTIGFWDPETGTRVGPEMRHAPRLLSAAFAPDGKRFLTFGEKTVRIWSTDTSLPNGPSFDHDAPIGIAQFHPSGQRVLVGDNSGHVDLWDLQPEPHRRCRIQVGGTVRSARFSPDGRRVLTAFSDEGQLPSSARLWDSESGAALPIELRHLDGIYTAKFSPDGRRIVTGSEDNTARVWDAATGEPVTPPLRHGAYIDDAAFSPDGRLLLTVSRDGSARLWEAATGEPVLTPLDQDSTILQAVWSPDGRELVTANRDHSVRLLDLSPQGGSVEQLRLQAELLASQRLLPASGSTPLTAAELKERWDRLQRAKQSTLEKPSQRTP